MEQSYLLITIIFIAVTVPAATFTNNCIEYSNGYCLRCQQGSRLVEGRCRDEVPGCLVYSKDQCLRCTDGRLPKQGACALALNDENSDLTLYALAFGQSKRSFVTVSLEESNKDIYFTKCDNFVRMSQYSHFISKAQTPWQSISLQVNFTSRNYRIIYLGAAGGLMLCTISISIETSQPKITSLVTISTSEQVPHCLDYSQCGKCSQCSEGYHLQQNKCYTDIIGCVSYYHQLCLECVGWALLIENRCLTDCPSQCDLVHVPFYGNTLLAEKLS